MNRNLTNIVKGMTIATMLFVNVNVEADSTTATNETAVIAPIQSREMLLQYKLIEEYAIYNVVSNYVSRIVWRIPDFKRKVEKRNGRNFDGKKCRFIDECVKEDYLPLLDVAYQRKTSDAEVAVFVDMIAKGLKKEDPVYCNYFDHKFQEMLKKRLCLRIKFYERLIETPAPSTTGEDGFREMIRSAYTANEFRSYLKEQNNVTDSYYDTMYRTLPLKYRIFPIGLISGMSFDKMKGTTKMAENGLWRYFHGDDKRDLRKGGALKIVHK